MIEELGVKLRILARAEMTLLKADAHRRTNRLLLHTLAIGCLLVALVFVNLAVFFLLTESEVNANAAFTLAGINLALAAIPFFMARSAKPGSEEQMVREIREMAAEEITRDLSRVSGEVQEVVDAAKQFRRGLTGGGGGALSAVGPLLPMLLDLLRKRKHH